MSQEAVPHGQAAPTDAATVAAPATVTTYAEALARAERIMRARPIVVDANQDYSIVETAILLCSSPSGVYRLAKAGVIKIKKRGRRSRIGGQDIINANAASS